MYNEGNPAMRSMAMMAALALLLQGCMAMSVQELQDSGVRQQAASSRPPDRAAGCIARNLEALMQGFVPNVRPAAQPGGWEVVMRTPTAIADYVVYALAVPSPNGTALSIWFSSITLGGQDKARQALRGC